MVHLTQTTRTTQTLASANTQQSSQSLLSALLRAVSLQFFSSSFDSTSPSFLHYFFPLCEYYLSHHNEAGGMISGNIMIIF